MLNMAEKSKDYSCHELVYWVNVLGSSFIHEKMVNPPTIVDYFEFVVFLSVSISKRLFFEEFIDCISMMKMDNLPNTLR